MPFKPGQSGNPGGRKKRLLARPDEILNEQGVHPILEILKLIPNLKESDQLKAWMELASYCHAKPKEIPVDENGLAHLTNEELIKLAQERIPLLKAG